MTTSFPTKESAKAEGCRLAGLKENILKDVEPTGTQIVGLIYGIIKEVETYTFKNVDGIDATIGISVDNEEDIFHKGRAGFHLWLFGEKNFAIRV